MLADIASSCCCRKTECTLLHSRSDAGAMPHVRDMLSCSFAGTLGLQVGGDVFDTTANATDVYVSPGNSICGPVPVNVTAYTADGKPAVLPACNAS